MAPARYLGYPVRLQLPHGRLGLELHAGLDLRRRLRLEAQPDPPLCAIALVNLIRPVLEAEGFSALCGLVIGGNEDVSIPMVEDTRLPLISFTGSTAIGKLVAGKVGARFGKGIFDCGGNNALIVMDDADLDMVLPATLFGAVGTAGQRCTSTRRLLVHESVIDEVEARLLKAYEGIRIGDPNDPATLCGPLIDEQAVVNMENALANVQKEGGKLLRGGGRALRRPPNGRPSRASCRACLARSAAASIGAVAAMGAAHPPRLQSHAHACGGARLPARYLRLVPKTRAPSRPA